MGRWDQKGVAGRGRQTRLHWHKCLKNFITFIVIKLSHMKHIISSLLILAVSFSCFAGSPERHTFKDQGLERIYYLHIPEGLESGAPLLFVLHGYGGRAENYCPGMIAVADKYGFALCYPEGSLDNRGKRCWNVGYPWQKDMKVDVQVSWNFAEFLSNYVEF